MNPQHTRRADFGDEVSNKAESDGHEGMSQRQVAKELGIGKSRVAEIESKALAKVRQMLIDAGVLVDDIGGWMNRDTKFKPLDGQRFGRLLTLHYTLTARPSKR